MSRNLSMLQSLLEWIFKGGSEPEVLNLTTWLKAKQGKQYCVSTTWNNNAALDESRFMTLYTSLLAALK